MATQVAGIYLSFQSVHRCQPHPFLRLMAATNRARHPSGSSKRPCHCLLPWRLRRPGRTLVPKRVQWLITDLWLSSYRLQSLAGSRCGRSELLQTGGGGTSSHSDPSALTPVAIPGLTATAVNHAKQRAPSNGLPSYNMWKQAPANLWANALIATTLFVFAFLRS